jgi:hypothetical protein
VDSRCTWPPGSPFFHFFKIGLFYTNPFDVGDDRAVVGKEHFSSYEGRGANQETKRHRQKPPGSVQEERLPATSGPRQTREAPNKPKSRIDKRTKVWRSNCRNDLYGWGRRAPSFPATSRKASTVPFFQSPTARVLRHALCAPKVVPWPPKAPGRGQRRQLPRQANRRSVGIQISHTGCTREEVHFGGVPGIFWEFTGNVFVQHLHQISTGHNTVTRAKVDRAWRP